MGQIRGRGSGLLCWCILLFSLPPLPGPLEAVGSHVILSHSDGLYDPHGGVDLVWRSVKVTQ